MVGPGLDGYIWASGVRVGEVGGLGCIGQRTQRLRQGFTCDQALTGSSAPGSPALQGVPVFNAANRTSAYRFVTLIDVFYEHRWGLLYHCGALCLVAASCQARLG